MARPKATSNLSIAQLEKMLYAHKNTLSDLIAQRGKVVKQLSELDSKIAHLGGPAGKMPAVRGVKSKGLTAGGRVRNEKSLVETLEEVLSGATAPMKVGEIVDGVLKSGYHTTSDNFRGIVNQTLIKERKRFGSEGRGLYSSKAKK